jgi:predicted nucleic-acid-binding protein
VKKGKPMQSPKYIVIEGELKKELDKNKIIPRERYNEVIARLIDNSKLNSEDNS